MVEIDSRLSDFNKDVANNIGGMNSMCQTIGKALSDVSKSTAEIKININNSYQSSNKTTVLNRIDGMNSTLSKIDQTVRTDLQGMIDKSSEIVESVKKLEEYKNQISDYNGIANSSEATDEAKASANSKIYDLTRDFNRLQDETLSKYNVLLEMDKSIVFISEFSANNSGPDLTKLKYGTFEHGSYKATNGEILDYYLYVPDYGEDVEGLSLHTYLHGSGEIGNGVLSCGLPKMIYNREINPECLCLILQAPDGKAFFRPSYYDAVVECENKIVEQYKCNPNKKSLSGHSMGAIAGYRMLARYPDNYAAFVPISGVHSVSSEIQPGTKIWAFHGENDDRIPLRDADSTIRKVKANGGDANLTVLEDKGHRYVQNYVFENQFEDSDGEMVDVLSWAARQERA